MTRLIIAGSKRNEDLLWATRFLAGDAFVFVQGGRSKYIVVDPLEYGRALKEARADKILQKTDFAEWKEGETPLPKQALLLLKKLRAKKVFVSPDFPASFYKYLSRRGITCVFKEPLFPEREIKTKEEIASIASVQRAMEEAFNILLGIISDAKIRDGKLWYNGRYLTSEFLRLTFDTEMMKRDCVCEETIIASGNQAVNPHCLGYGPIRANTPIMIDIFPRSRKSWYWSDMTRTVVKGKLSPKALALYKAVQEAQRKALQMVKPGVDASKIHDFVKSYFEECGFKTRQTNKGWEGFFHSTGHGVGMEIHEPPRVSVQKKVILKPGHVITIEPGLYYPGIGGVRIEDTVLVTKTGHRNLAKTPKDLIEL